jgi:uncharacterized protein YdbL (DUF1318 family)
MKNKVLIIVLSFFLLNFLAGFAFAQGIKDRMKARLPVIDSLKSKGIVGENRQGYLEFIKGKTGSEDVVRAENADRALVYQAIAKQQKTTPELVGKRRALQLADIAKPGEWLQDGNGKWYQK